MLKPCHSHPFYLKFLQSNLPFYLDPLSGYILKFVHQMILLDLSNLESIVKPLYCLDNGATARDPSLLFRSLILMTLHHETSIDKWCVTMRSFPIWAVLSGFSPLDIPGASTFRDFISRLWLVEEKEYRKERAKRRRRKRRKPKTKLKANQKLPPKNPGVVGRLAQRLLAGKMIKFLRPESVLNDILKDVFVVPSAKLGLLGDLKHFAISGDGSIIPTGANHFGIKTCDCKSKGIYSCDCPRIFTDLHASWGWDSHNEKWVYGHTLYEVTAANSFHNLPIFLMMPTAKRHDSVSGLVALFECLNLYQSSFSFSEFLGDSAHDAYAFYEVLDHFDIEALIDLNSRSKNFNLPQFKVDKDGKPICHLKRPMINWGYCKSSRRVKWRCPAAIGKFDCQFKDSCSSSDYGKTLYTKCATDLRLFTRTPRNTDLWKEKFKRRSGSERSFKRKLYDYNIEHTRVRSRKNLCFRYFLAAFCQHLDAWSAHSSLNIVKLVSSWVPKVA
jgi:hypothetical protein